MAIAVILSSCLVLVSAVAFVFLLLINKGTFSGARIFYEKEWDQFTPKEKEAAKAAFKKMNDGLAEMEKAFDKMNQTFDEAAKEFTAFRKAARKNKTQ